MTRPVDLETLADRATRAQRWCEARFEQRIASEPALRALGQRGPRPAADAAPLDAELHARVWSEVCREYDAISRAPGGELVQPLDDAIDAGRRTRL